MPPELQTVVDDHYQNLYRFAMSLTRSSDDAWDLTQEAFLRLAKKRSSIRSTAAIKSWLYTTLYREFLRIAKRGSRFDSWEDNAPAEKVDHEPSDQVKASEARDVMECLLELKDGYRQVVSLYYLESYSYKEIAAILEIPIGTVMSRLARGKEMLRAQLTQPKATATVVSFTDEKRKSSHG
ncbi:RNA polymerase sigma factor [Pelagicoccus sp. SDUM812005]|uniref:RNA polymerase sigma factor n=1 Tax=Pelagicoccus sp. SDUM812005 TaxID=3041257 RepID=UPI00280D8086|nr:RNA polymerase sigma factor [Pelagicoccus sp. SDUM812005]MDQ8179206.1 RNA polymerase sigma factor [Pelagicoccus sp. SDUM812005]